MARALLLALVVSACAGRPVPAPDRIEAAPARARPAPLEPLSSGAAPLSLEDAREALSRAMAAAAHADIVRHAGRVVALGGALTDAEAAAVLAAVDALPGRDLAALYGELDAAHAPAPLVALRLALLAEHVGDDRAARAWLARAAVDEALRERAGAVERRVAARRRVDPGVVAVLLPLSGPFAALGAELERGVRQAARAAGRERVLRVIDTAGDDARAVAAVERAVSELGAVAILGPVGERESVRAAARAAELGVPIALLAPGHDGAAPDAGVFRLWSSPAWEAREAARVAIELGYHQLAILAPRDEHGALAVRAFTEAARRAGAGVVSAGYYEPTATALEPDVRAFLGLDPATNERLRRHLARHGRRGWKTFSPDVPFELLYIPDEHRRAALVASYLPYFNVEVRSEDVMDIDLLRRKHGGRVPRIVQLLGSSGWHHPGLTLAGGAAVEGALVLDVFAGEELATDEAARFVQDFEERHGRPPSALAAQAYDAATLVLEAQRAASAARGDGRAVRGAFARALRGARLDPGVCGVAEVGADGQVRREAVLLRVDGGAFVIHPY